MSSCLKHANIMHVDVFCFDVERAQEVEHVLSPTRFDSSDKVVPQTGNRIMELKSLPQKGAKDRGVGTITGILYTSADEVGRVMEAQVRRLTELESVRRASDKHEGEEDDDDLGSVQHA
jgi:hypothetical protein